MTNTIRAYKLQEFVAHASNVNCLKIGKKSSRTLVTGGEDHKVNLWAIGKPNAIMSLSGHTSGIDSVSFDTSEAYVAAGAASGTVKLWDLEEAKIVRTLTGHRSNCISLDFHPFGEFFASGSLDTNLKIWDIRRKGCTHTYKGHTRGVNVIRFTPDGRWVVSGGEDNSVKLWDLTAGKLLHDFKCHDGPIQCIDFHPNEFLLATGSSDRTVKFWDLETFELIGSAGPETTGVRCMTFNPDGRTLLCGVHESLKVFSWEPIRCYDSVDVGWSRISDLNVQEGKLLGCSFNQSGVGVWVVDISRIEPYSLGNISRTNGHAESKQSSGANTPVLSENNTKSSHGRLSSSQNPDPVAKETKSLAKLSVTQNSEPVAKEAKSFGSTGSIPSTQKIIPNNNSKVTPAPAPASSVTVPGAIAPKRNTVKVQPTISSSVFNRSEVIPVIIPRHNGLLDVAESKKEITGGRRVPISMQTKTSDLRKISNVREEPEKPSVTMQSEAETVKITELSNMMDKNAFPAAKGSLSGVSENEVNVKDVRCTSSGRYRTNSLQETLSTYQHGGYENRAYRGNRDAFSFESQKGDENRAYRGNRDAFPVESQQGGRTRSIVANWEKRDRYTYHESPASSNLPDTVPVCNPQRRNVRGHPSPEKETVSATDEDVITDLLDQHNQFVGSMQSRLAKLQVVHRYWDRRDIKGALRAMEKMNDHAVLADVIGFLTEKSDGVTLDICTCMLPLLNLLLESQTDRHQGISLEMLLKMVRVFGSIIYSAVSASSPVGVDIEAEQRLERCNLCYIELEKVKHCLPVLSRKGGSIAKSAQELNLALQEIS
ncbi:katanin p80 WD40 repeat-containing subunit B1 homolog KTN80.4 [Impatiens glandulifera]|uniref:katanin p80 WD40 repeat-containing subunit B1 homolog KTN80.4 n=1 Tax=Impatiens glandulifera TaxID=253017 RepID=UPI001FB18B32|nr:katanin p80 WD40 repeat-containing subunit B1 homolog KTN80.4 [Impatiens glandulifera]